MTTTEDQAQAMLEFLNSFSTLSGSTPERLEDLSDGVAIFEAMSEFAPDYFDPTTIARHLGDNWALKSSNLRKLVRNLEYYFLNELGKDPSSVLSQLDLQSMAKDSDVVQIAGLLELLAVASVTCPDKTTYVSRILQMTADSQVELKAVLQTGLGKLKDYDGAQEDHTENDQDDDATDRDVDGEMVFGQDDDDDDAYHGRTAAPKNLFGNHHHASSSSTPQPSQILQLEQDLEESKRHVASLKSQMTMQQEDYERAHKKLEVMVEDLQGRLVQRQNELIDAEEELQKAVSELEDTKSKLADAKEEAARLADDLDVAMAKSNQLIKVEATLALYKQKLDKVGGVTQQMREAEDQSANYVKQIMELEAQVKKSSAAQKQVEQLQDQMRRLEKEKETMENQRKTTANEIAELKEDLKAANSSRRSLEEEVAELRAKLEIEMARVIPASPQARGFEDDLTQEQKSKLSRLELENESLRVEMEKLRISASAVDVKSVAASSPEQPATPVAAAVPMPAEDVTALHDKIKQLEEQLAQKDADNKKIVGDKDKLEAYTKRTLAKFQDKYLVALQECKLKLKEKQDKIESLEQRSAAERTAQKREERLLSSSVYELGMAIMQNRLKAQDR